MFSAFSNDGMGHKDMKEILSHPGFADVKVIGLFGHARAMGFPRAFACDVMCVYFAVGRGEAPVG